MKSLLSLALLLSASVCYACPDSSPVVESVRTVVRAPRATYYQAPTQLAEVADDCYQQQPQLALRSAGNAYRQTVAVEEVPVFVERHRPQFELRFGNVHRAPRGSAKRGHR